MTGHRSKSCMSDASDSDNPGFVSPALQRLVRRSAPEAIVVSDDGEAESEDQEDLSFLSPSVQRMIRASKVCNQLF